jgi:hypothetical protein
VRYCERRRHLCDAEANAVAVPDEYDIEASEPARNEFRLKSHVRYFHVDLVEFADRRRTILHDIGNRIDGGA